MAESRIDMRTRSCEGIMVCACQREALVTEAALVVLYISTAKLYDLLA